MKIADLFAEITFKWDTMKLNDFIGAVGKLNLSSLISAGTVAKLGSTIKDLLVDADKTSSALQTLSKSTGLDTNYIQKFEVFSESMGSTKEEADQFLATLNKIKFSISQGLGGERPFIIAGIDPFQEQTKLIEDINKKLSDDKFLKQWAGNFAKGAQNIKEMRAAFISFLGEGMGASPSMLKTLSSPDLVKQLSEASSIIVMTEQEIAKAAEMHKNWVLAAHDLNISFVKLATDLNPIIVAMTRLADETVRWADAVGRSSGFFKGLADVLNVPENVGKVLNEIKSSFAEGNKYDFWGRLKPEQTGKGMTNNITVTVHSSTPEEFVKRFDPVWKKYIKDAEVQFGNGQT